MQTEEILKNWVIAQNAGAYLPCPRCGRLIMDPVLAHNALSRREHIYICSNCGREEAVEDMMGSCAKETFEKLSVDNWFAVNQVFGQTNTPFLQIDGKWQITAKKTIKVTPQDIDDIMATALEDGIAYWCSEAEIVGDFLGDYASDQISRGGSLLLHDNENNDVYKLTLEKLLRGIQLWIEKERDDYGVVSGWELDCCVVDSLVADAMVQYALFSELVYG